MAHGKECRMPVCPSTLSCGGSVEKAGRPCKGEEGGVLYFLAASAGKQQGPGRDPGARTLRATYRERETRRKAARPKGQGVPGDDSLFNIFIPAFSI